MKRALFIISALALLATACQEKEVIPELTLASPSEVTVGTEGDIVSVSFNTNVDWTASIDNSNWSVTPTSGAAGNASLKVTALQNDSDSPVTATLTISAKTLTQKVTFTQLQKDCLSLDKTEAEISDLAQNIEIKVLANVDYKVESDVEWLKYVETRGAVSTTAIVAASANKGEAREGHLTFSGAGKKAEFTVKQAAFAPYFNIKSTDEYGYIYAPKEGGTLYLQIQTNVSYDITTYEDGAFPWQHVTGPDAEGVYTIVVDANDNYGERISYIKFTSSDYQEAVLDEDGNPTGEYTDMVRRVYIGQEGHSYAQYSLSMYDMEFDTWGTTVLSEAVYNGKHYISNGQDLYEVDPATGAFSKKEWFCGNGMTQKVITNDDAGNLIVCNHTAYLNDAYTDGYFILNAVTPDGKESNLITKAAWECGGPFGAEIKVHGDVTKDAVIAAPVEGISGITMSLTMGYWEVKDGAAGDFTQVTVTGFVGTWGAGAWNTYPNNFPTIYPLGTSASAGFIMSGSYEENAAYTFGTDGAASVALLPDPEQSGNYAYQTLDIISLNGKNFLVSVASTFFPEWGLTPVVSVVDFDNYAAGSVVHEVALFNRNGATYFAPDWDYGIAPAASVKLYNADGKLGIAYADLNARCVEGYVLDPAVLLK